MNHAARQAFYREIEKTRQTKVIAFVTGERNGLQTQIAQDAVGPFVALLDAIGPTKRISLILDTNGGQTSAAWRLIHLLQSFGDEVEVIIPTKAMSAGTLIALGSDRIVMTKQAALGPIDPSLDAHPLGPAYGDKGQYRYSVSAEAIRGYIHEVKRDVTDPAALASVWIHLSDQVHPLILGQIFRLGGQIRHMAKALIARQVADVSVQEKIINLLCSDSGSHDYTINRRVASDIGLNIEKPSSEFYTILTNLTQSYHAELKTLEPYSPAAMLGGQPQVAYTLVRGLIESTEGDCYGYVSDGVLNGPNQQNAQIVDNRSFEGWRKLP